MNALAFARARVFVLSRASGPNSAVAELFQSRSAIVASYTGFCLLYLRHVMRTRRAFGDQGCKFQITRHPSVDSTTEAAHTAAAFTRSTSRVPGDGM